MTDLLIEAIEEKRREVTERHESEIADLDRMLELAQRLGATTPTEPEPAPKPKKPPAKRRQATGKPGFKATPPEVVKEREETVLRLLREADPEPLPSKPLREALGFTSKSALRKVLEPLIENGRVNVTGERAGTRYSLSPKGRGKTERLSLNVEDDSLEGKVMGFLSRPRSISELLVNTEADPAALRVLLHRLRKSGKVWMRRTEDGEVWEKAR